MSPSYLRHRRADVHAEERGSQFSYVSRQLRTAIRTLVEQADLRPGASVVDYGCGVQPYRDEIPAGATYLGADLPGNDLAELEIAADGTIPLPDASVDLVLSTQVLEHVEEPGRYLAECRRVLRLDGSLVLSTHGIMYYHRDPEDYWRWTLPGLTKLLGDHDFEVVGTKGVLALAPAALQILQDGTMWKVPRRLQRAYAFVMQAAIEFADRRYDEVNRVDNCLTLAVRARRIG